MGWKTRTLIVLLIAAALVGGYFFLVFSTFNGSAIADGDTGDYRPQYCIGDKCVDGSVFSELPPYPKNFADIKSLTYPEPFLGMFENFSMRQSDDYYYKQPEFYGDSWKAEWMKYYTTDDTRFRCCSGPYPGDQMVSNLTTGDTYRIVTYWHAGPAIFKYQLIKLIPTYPSYGRMRMGTEEVSQDSKTAAECFDVSVDPENIIIEPTFPKFYSGWTQKVTLDIIPKCSGRWFVTMEPGDPDIGIEQDMIRTYGIGQISTIVSGGLWNILLVVN
jgi:hypothetical protein